MEQGWMWGKVAVMERNKYCIYIYIQYIYYIYMVHGVHFTCYVQPSPFQSAARLGLLERTLLPSCIQAFCGLNVICEENGCNIVLTLQAGFYQVLAANHKFNVWDFAMHPVHFLFLVHIPTDIAWAWRTSCSLTITCPNQLYLFLQSR